MMYGILTLTFDKRQIFLRNLIVLLSILAVTSSSYAVPLAPEGKSGGDSVDVLERIVAIVNDDVITRLELNAELDLIKQQLSSQRTAMPPDAVLRKQVLDRVVLMRIQLQRANSRLIRVDDETLNRAVESIANQNRMSLGGLRQALEADGVDYSEYRERIREEITVTRLQQREVHRTVEVTEQEVDDLLANRELQDKSNEEYRLEHILLVVPEASSSDKIQVVKQKAQMVLQKIREGNDFAEMAVTHSDGQQALSGGDLGWRKFAEIPTLFAEPLAAMKSGDVSDLIRSPSGFHIIKLSEVRQKDTQLLVDQAKSRHILISPSDILTVEEAKARISKLKQRIAGGEDFAQLAATNSDDKSSAVNGGELGWVNPGTMVKEFEDAMNELSVGEVSDPVRTQFGWHLIQVLERRKHDNTEEFQKNQAREIIRQRKIEPALQNWLRRIRDESFVELRL